MGSQSIERLLPPDVATAGSHAPLDDGLHLVEAQALNPETVPARWTEFTTGRACARRALAALGVAPGPIPVGAGREPIWPTGVVGSITHCAGYTAAAVARASSYAALGIDAEEAAPLPDGVLPQIVATGDERDWVGSIALGDRLLFSAKEAVYKAWFPLAHRWLGFEEAAVSMLADGRFRVRLLVPGPLVAGRPLAELEGRWLIDAGLVMTAVSVRASP